MRSKPVAVQLHTPRLILAPPRQRFAPATLAFFTSQKTFLAPWSPRVRPEFYELAFQQEKIKSEQQLLQDKKGLRFWIFLQEDVDYTTIIGQINFSNIVWGGFCSCFLGYSMAEAYNGQGLMTEALQAAIGFIFDQWHLHRLEANIMPRNIPSVKVVKKLGFAYEGHSPKYLKINGQWEDHDHYVLRNLALE